MSVALATLGVQCDNRAISMATLGVICGDAVVVLGTCRVLSGILYPVLSSNILRDPLKQDCTDYPIHLLGKRR